MNYYILPKINTIINVNPIDTSVNQFKPYISQSLLNYYNEMYKQIQAICENESGTENNNRTENNNETENNNRSENNNEPENNDNKNVFQNNFEELIKIVNPYEYIFSKVPGSKFSVSKLKPKTNLFYDFLEVCSVLNIFETYKLKPISTLHLSPNSNDTIECFEMIRENFDDDIMFYDGVNDETIKLIGDKKFDFLFFESKTENINQYISSLIEFLMVVFRNQAYEGTSIIKISDVFHKSIVDIVYILASLYDRAYILKPNTSNITTFDKYLVCKKFKNNQEKNINFRLNYFRLLVFLKKLENKHIVSILDYDIPYYFTMKLDDMNIISGQQQLESLDLVINILKNKNKEDKIETLKKMNIQKSVLWCEKYKIPCNKFSEKTNIFLPINKDVAGTSLL
jgi:hypothetical protein